MYVRFTKGDQEFSGDWRGDALINLFCVYLKGKLNILNIKVFYTYITDIIITSILT